MPSPGRIAIFTSSLSLFVGLLVASYHVVQPMSSSGVDSHSLRRSKKNAAPGSRRRVVITCCSREPGLFRQSFRFERANLIGVRQCQRNVVVTVKQALLAKRLDVEAIRVLAIGRAPRLRVQVDRQLEAGKCL